MTNNLFILLFLMVPVMEVFAQLPSNRVQWQDEPLNWKDFSGESELQNPFDASTNSGISYSWSLRTSEEVTEFLYKVEVFFYPDLSWVKPGKESPLLLAHEQLHLTITELHGRKLRKIMEEYVPDLDTDIERELERIYQKNETGRRQMQEKYDRETNHGQNEAAQAQWEDFIEAELTKFELFSS